MRGLWEEEENRVGEGRRKIEREIMGVLNDGFKWGLLWGGKKRLVFHRRK